MVCRAMMAVELIHSYSLIHDDLPCMDDDALQPRAADLSYCVWRRYCTTCRDALQSIAFEVLSEYYEEAPADEAVAYRLTQILSTRARRMVSGQMLDIKGETKCSPKMS